MIWSPTRVCSIVGRFGCDGDHDFSNVHALQRQLSLTAYDSRSAASAGVPAPDAAVPDELAFYEQLRRWMQAFPPAAPERTYQQRFAPLGCWNPTARPTRSRRPTWLATWPGWRPGGSSWSSPRGTPTSRRSPAGRRAGRPCRSAPAPARHPHVTRTDRPIARPRERGMVADAR
jgi:hypothetical protein